MIFQASFYKSKKVLLIEDYEPVRAPIKGMLQQIGCDDITAVADARHAMALTDKHGFHFSLADVDLGSGKDVLHFCNTALVLSLLQIVGHLLFERALKPLVNAALLALAFSATTQANQQKLAQLRSTLPQTYFD